MRLVLSDISRSYEGRGVLKGCSWSFDKEGIHVIMGANGCGKSTLLRICALLEEPDSGEVLFFSGEERLRKDKGLMRRMTLVLPRIGLFNATVFSNVAFGLRIRGERGRVLREHVMEALEFVGLSHKAEQNTLTLSSGESQRAGIARALAIRPEILFLDEPTASIDTENTAIIEAILAGLKDLGGRTIVMTTHDRAQAERLGDSLLFLREGCLEAL